MVARRPAYRGGTYGQVTDVEIFTRELLRTRDRINDILAYHTGQDMETIKRDTERDRWMTADEAKEYGLVDEVVSVPIAKLKETPAS